MMYGAFGAGWLMMFFMIGLPIIGVIIAALALAGFFQNRQVPIQTQNQPPFYQPTNNPNPGENQPTRYCVHCGAGLQPGWSHCPQCGAPIQS